LSVASAKPVAREISKFTLPIAANISKAGFNTILEADRARAAYFQLHSGPGTNHVVPAVDATSFYTASVGIGSPPTQYTLVVETGSSLTWIGNAKPYSPTSSSHYTGSSVSATYGSGSLSGKEYTDTVVLSQDLVIKHQSITVASKPKEFVQAFDGLLGLGPVDLTRGTLKNSPALVPTVIDNLFSQGTISRKSLGVSFEPLTSLGEKSGELAFGGIDASKTTGPVNPSLTAMPRQLFWLLLQVLWIPGLHLFSSLQMPIKPT